MKAEHPNQLVLEQLEPRRLLSGLWKGTDIDGDAVTVRLSGPGDMVLETTPYGDGEWIDSITLFDTARNSSLTVTAAKRRGGDGYVDIGLIDAVGEELRQINVDGYLDSLTVGQLKNLTVLGTAPDEEFVSDWTIDGDLGNLLVKYSMQDTDVTVGGDVNKVTIKGDLAGATLLIDGQLLNMQVNGDMLDSLVSVQGRINRIVVKGEVDYAEIETDSVLNRLDVYYDIVDSVVYATDGINNIVVDGSVESSVIESGGRIKVIDVWDWIADSEIIAGSQGINAIYAWNMSDTTVETDGNVGYIYLEAYDYNEGWDDLVIEVDVGWYWPVYDIEYIDVVFIDGGYAYYYDPGYWDVYYEDVWYEDYYWDTYGDVYYDDYYYEYDYYDSYYYDDYYYADEYYYDDSYYYYDYGYDYYYDTTYYDYGYDYYYDYGYYYGW